MGSPNPALLGGTASLDKVEDCQDLVSQTTIIK